MRRQGRNVLAPTEGRGDSLNDFEQIENLQKVATIFDSLSLSYIQRINAQGSIEDIHTKVLSYVLPIISSTLRTTE